jgi:APA family basic amino acid/polyamine antiporter
VPVAVAAVVALMAIVVMGIQRSNRANIVIVAVTLFALVVFVLAGLPQLWSKGTEPWLPFFRPAAGGAPRLGLLQATALMFVAFTGYARIATLGEEMREPERTIPPAIIATLVVSGLLYIAVGAVGIATIGPEALAEAARSDVAPLVAAARTFDLPYAVWIVGVGAITAMLGVALNLILGLSRVVLAMGRRGDMPSVFARVDESGSPRVSATGQYEPAGLSPSNPKQGASPASRDGASTPCRPHSSCRGVPSALMRGRECRHGRTGSSSYWRETPMMRAAIFICPLTVWSRSALK